MTRFSRRCLPPIIGDHFTIAGACITSNAEGSASAAPSPHQPSVEAGPSAPSGSGSCEHGQFCPYGCERTVSPARVERGFETGPRRAPAASEAWRPSDLVERSEFMATLREAVGS